MPREKGEKTALSQEEDLENDFRIYWRVPRLASQLSKEQREKVTEKFLELAEKSRRKHTKQIGETMKQRLRLLRLVTKEKREK